MFAAAALPLPTDRSIALTHLPEDGLLLTCSNICSSTWFGLAARSRTPVRGHGSRPLCPRAGPAGSGVVWGSATPEPVTAVAVFPRRLAHQRTVTNEGNDPMTRRYDDPVDVRRRDDVPAEFLWRGRLYVVREVLIHWVESGAWWRSPVAPQNHPSGEVSPAPAHIDDEFEVWRVEASAGRLSGTGVFDLGFTWSRGSWTLLQALD